MSRETFHPGTKIDGEKHNQLLNKCAVYFQECDHKLHKEFMQARTLGQLVVPKERK
jgi:hypothetical protein